MSTSKNGKNQAQLEELSQELAEHRLRFWQSWERGTRILQKTLIWAAFFLILFLLKDFFTLIFLTFVLSFVSTSITRVLGRVFPSLGWRPRVILVFSAFLIAGAGVVHLAIPQIKSGLSELNSQVAALPTVWEEKIDPWLYEKSGFYEQLVTEHVSPNSNDSSQSGPDFGANSLPGPDEIGEKNRRISLWKNEQIRDWIEAKKGELFTHLPTFLTDAVTAIAAIFSLVFLSLLFSFLIVLDIDSLRREIKKLESTRLSEFYRETIGSIVRFGSVLGKVLEAQAVIAIVNACLTAVGLAVLDIPNIWFLSFAVFVCGFIPVAGVFISSVPICLVGLYVGGVEKMLILIAFITIIHFLEAYILNPRIMGAALHINPILVLIILVIGHHALGVWGLLLGLPICYYFFTHVIKREKAEIGLRVKFRKRTT